jgi:hypothetical protein
MVGYGAARSVHKSYINIVNGLCLIAYVISNLLPSLQHIRAMKHGVAFRKLSRTSSHRMLMLR